MYTLTGKVRWASVLKPNTKFEPVYQVDVEIDDPRIEDFLKDKGFKIREWDDGVKYLKVKRKVNTRKGTPASPPKVLAEDGSEFTDLIGNGSICTVGFDGFEYNGAMGKGTAAYLQEVVVKEHVPFAEKIDIADMVAA